MKKTLFLLMAISFLAACHKEDDSKNLENNYLIFGYFSCFCNDCCNDAYKIAGGQLFQGVKTAQQTFEFEPQPMDGSKYEVAKKLLDELPAGLLDHNGELLGCGGCLDQPVYYVELKQDGVVYHWKIDSDISGLPDYVQNYGALLTDILDHLQ